MNTTLLIMAVTLERYLAICWPLKSATWRTVRRAKLTIPTIFVFSSCYNWPYLRTSGLSENILCAAVSKHDTGSKAWAWWGFVLNFVIPFCFLVTMNTFIVRAIHCRPKRLEPNKVKMKRKFTRSSTRETIVHTISKNNVRASPDICQRSDRTVKEKRHKGIHRTHTKQDSNNKIDNSIEENIAVNIKMINDGHHHENHSEEQTTVFSSMLEQHECEPNRSDTIDSQTSMGSRNSSNMENRHQRQLTVMLLVVTTAFLVLTSPQYIRYIIFSFLNITQDEETFALATLLYHMTNKLFYTNSAVNFYLYCIAGSKFRTDVRLLWKQHFKKRKHVTATYKSSFSE